MANPSDYLLAASVSLMRQADNSFYQTVEDIKTAFENSYPGELDADRLGHLARSLEKIGVIEITSDKYAGDYITPASGWGVSNRLTKLKESSPKHGLFYALEGGDRLLNLALKSSEFWADLDDEIKNAPEEPSEEIDSEIPASDRLVSLSHNQFKEIDEPAGKLLDDLEKDNGIPDEPGLKERLTGQIRAGRELLRAGEFQLEIFRSTMLSGLEEIKDRYGDHAIGAAASALLTLILHILGLPGF